jgi:hypothetical protein
LIGNKQAKFFGGKAFLFVILQNSRKEKGKDTHLATRGRPSYTHPVKHPMSFDPTTILFPMEEHNSLPNDEVKVRSSAAAMLSNACQW